MKEGRREKSLFTVSRYILAYYFYLVFFFFVKLWQYRIPKLIKSEIPTERSAELAKYHEY